MPRADPRGLIFKIMTLPAFSRLKRYRDVHIDPKQFITLLTGTTVLDVLLSSYVGLPKGVLYLLGGDPGTGKSTLLLFLLSSIQQVNPGSRVLFISFEMNQVDLASYMLRFPKFQDIEILFLDSNSVEDDEDVLETMEAVLSEGYDVVGIDSHVVAQGLIAENLGITMKRAENRLLKMMKNQMLGNNARRLMTSFINIQQMVKSGDFAGTMALQHAVDATMELRLEKRNNINSDRYIVFSKHRRGTPFQKLYFSLAGVDGSVAFDEDRFKRDQMAQKIQEDNRRNLQNAADAFDNLFNQNDIDEQ